MKNDEYLQRRILCSFHVLSPRLAVQSARMLDSKTLRRNMTCQHKKSQAFLGGSESGTHSMRSAAFGRAGTAGDGKGEGASWGTSFGALAVAVVTVSAVVIAVELAPGLPVAGLFIAATGTDVDIAEEA